MSSDINDLLRSGEDSCSDFKKVVVLSLTSGGLSVISSLAR
jgi:hypothetical protein